MRAPLTVLLDALVVIAFVAIGRSNHHEAASVVGFLHTLWPFAAGLALGLVLSRQDRSGMRSGVITWLGTLVLGMLLRAVTGQGVALTFVLVAAVFLGVAFLGWRSVVMLARRAEHARS